MGRCGGQGGSGFIFSSAGTAELVSNTSDWETGSLVSELHGDSDYERVMKVEADPDAAEWTAAIGFKIENFEASCTILTFAVKSDDLTEVFVEFRDPRKQATRGPLVFPLEDQIALGNGWSEVVIPLADLKAGDLDASAFGIHGGFGMGGSFRITDVRLIRDPWGKTPRPSKPQK